MFKGDINTPSNLAPFYSRSDEQELIDLTEEHNLDESIENNDHHENQEILRNYQISDRNPFQGFDFFDNMKMIEGEQSGKKGVQNSETVNKSTNDITGTFNNKQDKNDIKEDGESPVIFSSDVIKSIENGEEEKKEEENDEEEKKEEENDEKESNEEEVSDFRFPDCNNRPNRNSVLSLSEHSGSSSPRNYDSNNNIIISSVNNNQTTKYKTNESEGVDDNENHKRRRSSFDDSGF